MTDARGTSPSGPDPKRFRVVAVVDDTTVAAAVARTIDRVAALPVDIVGILVQPQPVRRTLGARLNALVDTVDRACFRPNPDAFRPVDLGDTHPGLLAMGMQPGSGPDTELLDIVLDLTSAGVTPSLERMARFGIWSLRYGEHSLPLGPAAFAREFARGSEVSITELVARGQTPTRTSSWTSTDGRAIYRSAGDMDRYSPARTRNAAAWKAAEFPARVLSDLLAGVGLEHAEVTVPRSPGDGQPTVRSVVGLVSRVVARGLREAVRRLVERPGWFVAIRVGHPDQPTSGPTDMSGFRPLVPPSGRFYADPFIVRNSDGRPRVRRGRSARRRTSSNCSTRISIRRAAFGPLRDRSRGQHAPVVSIRLPR